MNDVPKSQDVHQPAALRGEPEAAVQDRAAPSRISEIADALMAYEQCDMDGVQCKVSRQACHEAADALRSMVNATPQDLLSSAARDVLAERRRQVEIEGWTPKHDDGHSQDEMARAAVCYALPDWQRYVGASPFGGTTPTFWPWSKDWWKPKSRRQDLIKAGALILAEIERLDRMAEPPQAASGSRRPHE